MYLLNSNFSLLKNVGDLSSKKIEQIKETFGHQYPEIFKPNENALLLRKGGTGLAIQNERITYIYDGDSEAIDLSFVVTELLRLNEILELSNQSQLVCNLDGIYSYDGESMNDSKNKLREASNLLNAQGLGFRFIILQSNFRGDINIEPYIKDTKKIYIKGSLESVQKIDDANISDYFKDMYNYSTEKAIQASRNIFN